MNALMKLWAAFAGLAEKVNGLAATVGEINTGLRLKVGLDEATGEPTGQPEAVENSNGRKRVAVK